MPIQVTCPGCHTRFNVAEQHAGKQGACPKCREKITIPEPGEEVIIHAPEHSEGGARDAKGRSVLKPIRRKDAKFQPLMLAGVLAATLLAFLVAFLFRSETANWAVMTLGAMFLGPPLAWAGYSFLRDPELAAYTGSSLVIRSILCGLVYALLWGVYWFLFDRLWGADAPVETWQMFLLGPLILGIGTFAAYVSFDLEPASGFFHYALYLLVTVLLRMTMGQPPV